MTTFERLDFVPLDGGKLLVVVVAAGGHVTHKVIETTEEYEPGELQQAANYLNHEFKGRVARSRCVRPLSSGCVRNARSTTN